LLFNLRKEGIEVRLVKRRDYDEETVQWADAVIAAGGNCFIEIQMLGYGNAPQYSVSPEAFRVPPECRPLEF
jgi:ABC-type uncharacterized transport system involved in gliding motility auxiliary subunit